MFGVYLFVYIDNMALDAQIVYHDTVDSDVKSSN